MKNTLNLPVKVGPNGFSAAIENSGQATITGSPVSGNTGGTFAAINVACAVGEAPTVDFLAHFVNLHSTQTLNIDGGNHYA